MGLDKRDFEICPFGDRALLITLGNVIDAAVNEKIFVYDRLIKKRLGSLVRFTTPAYCSLTVGYDHEKTSFEALKSKILELREDLSTLVTHDVRVRLEIPVCYEGQFAPDMQEVTEATGLSAEQLVEMHSSVTYRVYMMGFLPGFPYLGKLPDALKTKRKLKPRERVPSGAVGLAGLQTGIYPGEAPGGWQIIGQVPFPLFSPISETPFTFCAGDEVNFRPIGLDEFHGLKAQFQGDILSIRNQLIDHG